MSTFFYWVGLIVCTLVATAILFTVLYSLAAAISVHALTFILARKRGGKLFWPKLPISVVSMWWEFFKYGVPTKMTHKDGVWQGIFNWKINRE